MTDPSFDGRAGGRPEAEIDAVVFDVGGVLLDWNPHHLYRSLIPDDDARERFLTEVCTSDWNAAQDAGRSWADAVTELSAAHPHHADLIAAYDLRWAEMVAGPVRGSVEILTDLRVRGMPTYALTNFSAEKWPVAQSDWPFLRAFDGAVVSGAEMVAKPDPAIYQLLLERYGLDAARTFYVDDVETNVAAARAVGLQAEVFVDADTLRRQLAARHAL